MTLAVLDTNVIWGNLTRDLLFTLTELEHYQAVLSPRILDALRRHGVPKRFEQLIKRGVPADQATQEAERQVGRLLAQVKSALSTRIYDNYKAHLERCENNEDDRHVLALAIANDVRLIVTENLKHFPTSALSPHGVEAISLDTFLSQYFSVEQLLEALVTISKRYKKPSYTVDELIEQLESRHQLTRTVALLRGAD